MPLVPHIDSMILLTFRVLTPPTYISIKVRTPYEALEYWYNLKPDLFIREPDMFRSVIFGDREQRGET
jgi:hypothetical protein